MTNRAADHFDAYYADKLWKLMPAVYRTLDTDQFDANGPLREMVNRIGGAAADVRRSIDRLWDDQSIETCDDWVIPYIGDLLDTRLVLSLDSVGQRRDVANTIDYRRRKGTLGVIEQVAYDLTNWDVKVVEFFRRLGRTRHGLDPAIGDANSQSGAGLAEAEGLVGQRTRTPIGGFADLRDVAGALNAGTAFDEFFHTADTRLGQGGFGWYAIPRLGVFVWRLESFVVGPVTPVAVEGCPGWFCFDPTGRNVPLFCRPRGAAVSGSTWTSPGPTDVAAPITQALLDATLLTPTVDGAGQTGQRLRSRGWGDQIANLPKVGDVFTIDGVESSDPSTGQPSGEPRQFSITEPVAVAENGVAFLTIAPAIAVGVGGSVASAPVDQAAINRIGSAASTLYTEDTATPQSLSVQNPGLVAAAQLKIRPTRGRFFLSVPATHALSANYAYGFPSEIGAGPFDRSGQATPIPTTPSPAKVSGGVVGGQLTEGTIEVADSLTYGVQTVTVTGELTIQSKNQERPLLRLAPGTSWVIRGVSPSATLTLDGLFVSGGDILLTGAFASVTLACCTLDPGSAAAAAPGSPPVTASPPASPPSHGSPPAPGSPPSGPYRMSADGRPLAPTRLVIEATVTTLAVDRSILGPVLTRAYSPAADPPAASPPSGANGAGAVETTTISNSIVQALSGVTNDAALAFSDGVVNLSRCTVLGRVVAHRLQASECILRELALVDNQQDGCVRFSAVVPEGRLPKSYECVLIYDGAPLFVSTEFGNPAYAQLSATADSQIRPPQSSTTSQQNTILAGAADGSEMGAYARDKNPIRARALLLKMQEYMPAGLVPVVVNVT